MIEGHLFLAYHGCDVTLRDDLVSGKVTKLLASENNYDWLGSGSYFFEDDEERALLFAKSSSENPERFYTAEPIATPAVVGAVLCCTHCLDLTTQRGLREFSKAYETMVAGSRARNLEMPENKPASNEDQDVILRYLDRAVIQLIHSERESDKDLPNYQIVRGAFSQGSQIGATSAFKGHSHIQLALRDTKCVVGWFLVAGDKLMDDAQRGQADANLAQAKQHRRDLKPRRRA